MKLAITMLAIILFPLLSIGQDLHVSGKVVDAETKETLPFATIFLIGTSVRTISNADGEFDFTIPDSNTKDTLGISVMGYAQYRTAVINIKDPQYLLVKLQLRSIPLNEVIITEHKIKPEEIVRKAFERVENNFPIQPYMLKAFYREMHLENDRSVKLIEAAIDIFDSGYKGVDGKRFKEKEKVNLKNVRASKNYRHDCFKQTVVERYNLVASALRHNPIRYRNANTKQWMHGKTFTMDSLMYLNDRLVYVVSFLSYLSGYPNFERKNTIYIDAENHAIYKYLWEEYAKEGKYSEKPWPLTKESIYLSNRKRISTIYEYGSYQGKMYLKYFDEKCYDDIMNSKTNAVEFESLGHITLIIGQIETVNIKMPEQETLRRDQSLATQLNEYQPEFWSNYEQVRLVPLTRKNVKDLERQIQLELQFQSEGSRK